MEDTCKKKKTGTRRDKGRLKEAEVTRGEERHRWRQETVTLERKIYTEKTRIN